MRVELDVDFAIRSRISRVLCEERTCPTLSRAFDAIFAMICVVIRSNSYTTCIQTFSPLSDTTENASSNARYSPNTSLKQNHPIRSSPRVPTYLPVRLRLAR
jgi:hypothetical protein